MIAVTRDSKVETAEALVALVHNTLDDFSAAVFATDPADLHRGLQGKSLVFRVTGPKDDMENRQDLIALASKDLRGWLIGQAREALVGQLVGRSADLVGRMLLKFGKGKWKLELLLEKTKAVAVGSAAVPFSAPAPVASGTTAVNVSK